MTAPVLVSCGEASGDRIVARVAKAVAGRRALFGMAGRAGASSGVELVVDAERVAVMGLADVVAIAPRLLRAFRVLQAESDRREPGSALLVGFTEFNQRLGSWLRKRGVRVVWCAAPQVWAWREGRLRTLRASVDQMAVLLPFEEALWRAHGYDVQFVGHPCVESTRWQAPRMPGRVAVLCGSRGSEVRRTGCVLIRAAAAWIERHPGWEAQAIEAPGLEPGAAQVLRACAASCAIEVVTGDDEHGAAGLLEDFDLALCVSGTASLEAAASGALPVVAYRFDALSAAVARRVVRTPHIALPNVILGERAFPELVQGDVRVERVVQEAETMLDGWDGIASAARRVRDAITVEDGRDFGGRMAAMINPPSWAE